MVDICVYVCPPGRDCMPQCRISLSGEGDALYSVLSSLHNNQLYLSVVTKKKHLSKMLSSQKNDVQSFADGACRCVKI